MTAISAAPMKRRSINRILNILSKTYPDAKVALHFSNPLEMLVSTILSAQCTDKRVNLVTKDLFKKYKTPEDYVNSNFKEFESQIKPTGFYRVKYEKNNLLELGKLVKAKKLDTRDRFGLQNDLYAFVRSGDYSIDDYLDFMEYFTDEDEYLPLVAMSSNLKPCNLLIIKG